MARRKRIALICFDNPYLMPMEGGKRAMLTRIESLGLLDVAVDVFLLNKPAEGLADLDGVTVKGDVNLFQFPMKSRPSVSLFSKYPICVAKRHVPELAARLDESHYDAIIYEGAQVASYRFEGYAHADKHILYYHDIESIYRFQLAESESNYFKRLLQYRESLLFKRMENSLGDLFDSHLFVSCEELVTFSAEHNLRDNTTRYAPYSVNRIAESAPTEPIYGRILYVGDMSLDSNYLSVEWFVREVMPIVYDRFAKVELRLIGRISDTHRKHLESLGSYVRILGYVDDLEAEYRCASCMVCPILYGAGVKVKLIDALAKGQIVIANTKACEGTEILEAGCLLSADSPGDMARICLDVLAYRDDYVPVARKALTYIRKHHSMESQATLLREEIG